VTESTTTTSHGGHDLGFWLLTLNVRYKENVGGIIRVASNYGASGVVFVGEGSYRGAAARGLESSVPLLRFDTPEEALQWLARERLFLVAVERTSQSTPIHQATWPQSRLCFAVGSEQDGLPAEFLENAGQVVDVPMYGQSASMNLAVAAAVLSYEHVRRLGFPPRPDLNISGRVSGWNPKPSR
jgi:tRNA G18 (ribose-2'-O)-methylase SpoU